MASNIGEFTVDVRVTPSIELEHQQMVHALVKPGEVLLASLSSDRVDLWHGATGVCTEAGELLDAIKKMAIYNKQLDRDNVIEELGDLEFYMQQVRNRLDITREETLIANMKKLAVRYQNYKYTDQAAADRADKLPVVDSVNPHTDLPIN